MRLQIHVAILVLFCCAAAAAEKPTAKVYSFPESVAGELLRKTESGETPVADAMTQLAKLDSSTRWAGSTRDHVVWVYVFYRNDPDKFLRVKFDEKPRETVLVKNLGELVQIAAKIAGLAAAAKPIVVKKVQYKLTEVRSDLTITASLVDEKVEIPGTFAAKPDWIVVIDLTGGGQADNAASGVANIVTGPHEGWSISADVGLNRLNQLKVNDSNGLELKEKPSTFYVSLDYAPWSDLFVSPKSLPEAVTFKFLLSASRTPTAAYGVGVGLRPGYFASQFPGQSFIHILDTISPYVAAISLREAEKDAAGVVTRGDRGIHFQAGVSIDLKTARGWLTPKKAEGQTQ